MKPFALFALLAALSACAMTAVPPPPPPPPPAAPAPPPPPPADIRSGAVRGGAEATATDCALTIVFASYGAGIDGATRTRVEALLASDRAVTGFEAQRWGREGEVNLCVRTRTAGDATRLYHGVRAMVPPRPRGPISLRTRAGLSFETPPLR